MYLHTTSPSPVVHTETSKGSNDIVDAAKTSADSEKGPTIAATTILFTSASTTEATKVAITAENYAKSKCIQPNWQRLIEGINEVFESCKENDVNVEEVEKRLRAYISNEEDWSRYALFDPTTYSRNLVYRNQSEKFSVLILCWGPGQVSPIHDHPNCHCFMKVLKGSVRESLYYWPHEKQNADGSMVQKRSVDLKPNEVTYMNDKFGVHSVGNVSSTANAVTMHIYSPAIHSCQKFDELTGNSFTVQTNHRKVTE